MKTIALSDLLPILPLDRPIETYRDELSGAIGFYSNCHSHSDTCEGEHFDGWCQSENPVQKTAHPTNFYEESIY